LEVDVNVSEIIKNRKSKSLNNVAQC